MDPGEVPADMDIDEQRGGFGSRLTSHLARGVHNVMTGLSSAWSSVWRTNRGSSAQAVQAAHVQETEAVVDGAGASSLASQQRSLGAPSQANAEQQAGAARSTVLAGVAECKQPQQRLRKRKRARRNAAARAATAAPSATAQRQQQRHMATSALAGCSGAGCTRAASVGVLQSVVHHESNDGGVDASDAAGRAAGSQVLLDAELRAIDAAFDQETAAIRSRLRRNKELLKSWQLQSADLRLQQQMVSKHKK